MENSIMRMEDTGRAIRLDIAGKVLPHITASAREQVFRALTWAPWEPAVRDCLNTGNVCFIAQGIFDSLWKPVKRELLARLWYEGRVSPYLFTPLIETTENNNVFDYIVVEAAFRQISQNKPILPCAINVNPTTFEHGDYFFEYVTRLQKAYEINTSGIILEILETEPINDYVRFNKILAKFRKEGYSIAVDDFHPVGNHNIFCVDHLFEIDTVKFDGIYMCEIYEHRGVKNVTQELKDTLAKITDKHPHINFVVEKIENESMFECFRVLFERLGIAEKVRYQGYYFDHGSPFQPFSNPCPHT